MPKRDNASKNPPNRIPAAMTAEVRLDAPLLQAIEEERARLMQVESLLDCMLVAMDNDDDSDAEDPYYPNIIELARELVNKVIGQLDTVKLKPLIQQVKDGTPQPLAEEKLQIGFGDHMVKDGGVLYVS